MSRTAKHNSIGRLVFSLLLLAVTALILLYRQTIIDELNIRRFQPSAVMSGIVSRTTMTPLGQRFFYASLPTIEDRTVFNQVCATGKNETTAVLGCYTGQRIFLFNVTDAQLNGIKEVTAAHEMLHAAYDRLDAKEKQTVNALLERQAEQITDPDFKALIAEYDKTEPGERLNELHSLIGTQISSIDPELEAYYSRYFSRRATVVDLYSKYNTVFVELKASQQTLSDEITQLSRQISDEVSEYNEATSQLDSDIKSFNSKAENGSFDSRSEFERERNRLLARQGALAATRDGLNVSISTYNTKRNQLAAINSEADALNRSINSNLNPLPSI